MIVAPVAPIAHGAPFAPIIIFTVVAFESYNGPLIYADVHFPAGITFKFYFTHPEGFTLAKVDKLIRGEEVDLTGMYLENGTVVFHAESDDVTKTSGDAYLAIPHIYVKNAAQKLYSDIEAMISG